MYDPPQCDRRALQEQVHKLNFNSNDPEDNEHVSEPSLGITLKSYIVYTLKLESEGETKWPTRT